MRYRQWKKNYKKSHGVNPPASIDKRKQRKQTARAIKALANADLSGTLSRAADALVSGMANFMRALGGACDRAGTACRDVADGMQPLEYESVFSLEVRGLSKSGYAVYEKNALSGSETLRIATYSKTAAEKIVEILQNDELEYVKRTHPEWIKRRSDAADSLRLGVITAYERGAFESD